MEQWGQIETNPSGYKYKDKQTNPFFSYNSGDGPGPSPIEGSGLKLYTSEINNSGFQGYEVGAGNYGTYTVAVKWHLSGVYNGINTDYRITHFVNFTINTENIDFTQTQTLAKINAINMDVSPSTGIYYIPSLGTFNALFKYENNKITLEENSQTLAEVEGLNITLFELESVEVTYSGT